jgi:hypothetical protein
LDRLAQLATVCLSAQPQQVEQLAPIGLTTPVMQELEAGHVEGQVELGKAVMFTQVLLQQIPQSFSRVYVYLAPGIFLGFNIRQYHVGRYKTRSYRGQTGFKTLIKPSKQAQKRHLAEPKQLIRRYRGASQAGLIGQLNPLIRGWARYYRTCSSKRIFNQMSGQLYHKLLRWAAFRHPRSKYKSWWYTRYWQRVNGKIRFSDGEHYLYHYEDMKIKRHTKVVGSKSPFDGDWVYWAGRRMKDPLKPVRVVKLLKWQQGTGILPEGHRTGHRGLWA